MTQTETTIREFQTGDESAFRILNEEWITRYFVMEAKDKASLADPYNTIVVKGGRIFFAISDDQPIGCCALLAMEPGEFEVAKMAVTETSQRTGIGRRLLEATIAEAHASGARRLYLETNRKLANAIRLYESVGFRHLPLERIVPSPYARADVYMELNLTAR
ncbi:MAG: GNAT family N-acetyltransferase [Bryobacteraceae bacterium]